MIEQHEHQWIYWANGNQVVHLCRDCGASYVPWSQAEIKRLRAALQEIADYLGTDREDIDARVVADIAREAIAVTA